MRRRDRDHDGRDERDRERERTTSDLAPERPRRRARANRGRTTTRKRVRDEHEREIDRVDGEKAVGVRAVARTCGRESRPRRAAETLTAAIERPVRRPLPTALRRPERLPCIDAARRYFDLVGRRARRAPPRIRRSYKGRTCLVTGADGFMGSHLTDALVELGAEVLAFVRATSSGALNNIGAAAAAGRRVVFADLTDKTSIDYMVRDLKQAPDRPYVFHLGAQAHVGESWHRPYETVMANTVGTLNLLQSIVDHGLELEKFDTAGTSEEYGNVRESGLRTTTTSTRAAA